MDHKNKSQDTIEHFEPIKINKDSTKRKIACGTHKNTRTMYFLEGSRRLMLFEPFKLKNTTINRYKTIKTCKNNGIQQEKDKQNEKDQELSS